MFDMDLNRSERKEFNQLLRSSHRIDVEIIVMDLNHRFLGDISNRFLNGNVTIDTTSDVTRTLSLELFDYDHAVQLDKNDPHAGSPYPTRMIRAIYLVGREDGSKWYEVPVFTGPLSKVERDGVILKVECQGKESLSMSALWNSKTYKKGWLKVSLLRNAFQNFSGENKFDFASSKSKTTKETAIKRNSNPLWKYARKLANTMHMQLFYDGRGFLRLRRRPGRPVWSFNDGMLLDSPQVGFSLDGLINAAQITGKTPKGKKKAPTAKYVAPRSHPLSPHSLGRNGVPRYLPHIEQSNDYRSMADCMRRAKAVVNDGLLQAVDVSAPVLPVPHLEEEDMIAFSTDKYHDRSRLLKATIPLVCSESMAIGYTKKLRPSRLSRKIRRL